MVHGRLPKVKVEQGMGLRPILKVRVWALCAHLHPGVQYVPSPNVPWFTRMVAYGAKWYRWYSRQHYKIKAKTIPIRFRERKLIDSEATAEYTLAAPLQIEYKRLWPATGPP